MRNKLFALILAVCIAAALIGCDISLKKPNVGDPSAIVEYNLTELTANIVPSGAEMAPHLTQMDAEGNIVLKYLLRNKEDPTITGYDVYIIEPESGKVIKQYTEPLNLKPGETLSLSGKYSVMSVKKDDSRELYYRDNSTGTETLIPIPEDISSWELTSNNTWGYEKPHGIFFTDDERFVFAYEGVIGSMSVFDPATGKSVSEIASTMPFYEKNNLLFINLMIGKGYSIIDISDLSDIKYFDLSESEDAKQIYYQSMKYLTKDGKSISDIAISPDGKYLAGTTENMEFISSIPGIDLARYPRAILVLEAKTGKLYKTFYIYEVLHGQLFIKFIDNETMIVTCDTNEMYDDYLCVINITK